MQDKTVPIQGVASVLVPVLHFGGQTGETVRRVIYSVAASLDGYISGPNGEFDWIPDEPAIDWDAFMNRFDTLLMGRMTYENALKSPSGTPFPSMQTYVFSRTLSEVDDVNVILVKKGASRVVNDLRQGSGKDIWLFGGGILLKSFLKDRLVDGIEIGFVPILLGNGRPLLPPQSYGVSLTLRKTKSYPSGIVLLTYDVVRDETGIDLA